MKETTLKHAVAAAARPVSTEARRRADVSFPDIRNMKPLLGEYDRNIVLLENRLGVTIAARGANLRIDGSASAVDAAEQVLRDLYRQVEGCIEITDGIIDTCLRAVGDAATRDLLMPTNVVHQISIRTKLKTIVPRTPAQASYMMALERDEMVFALGPAGTGKTYIAVAQAISKLMRGEVSKLILSRPAVEAGEKLGFLPGDMKEKVDPYLRPLYDAMHDCMPADQVERRLASGEIEVAPLAFMRGRTLADAFIILDEAQNTTPAQMKMFLTRFGENSRMVICGDPNQTDLPGGTAASGLTDAVARLERVQGITMSRFGAGDVVRHPIVGRIVDAYEG